MRTARIRRGQRAKGQDAKKRVPKPPTLPAVPHPPPPQTLADYLMGASKFGGTNLERLVDNAAKKLGFEFDAAQWVVPLLSTAAYTVIDRVLFKPRTAVYVDGVQHSLRLDREQTDFLQDNELRDMGWLVIRLKYDDLLRDPLGTVRKVMFGLEY